MISRKGLLESSCTITVILILMTLSPLFFEIDAREGNMPSRSDEGVVERDFDVQFMIEPENDTLSPWYGNKISKLNPGAMGRYRILISNLGPINDTFDLELSEPPQDAGWHWYFEDTETLHYSVNLSSGDLRDIQGGRSFTTVSIEVLAPCDAYKDTQLPINVFMRSRFMIDSKIEDRFIDNDTLLVVVGDIHWGKIPIDGPTLVYMDYDDHHTIPFILYNMGNQDEIWVELKVVCDLFWRTSPNINEQFLLNNPIFIRFNWTEITVRLKKGESKRIELNLTPEPDIFDRGEVYQFRIFGRSTFQKDWVHSDVVTIIGGQEPPPDPDENETGSQYNSTENETSLNHPPTAVISNPLPYVKYVETGEILFDASMSTDKDLDNITCLWVSNIDGYLGTGSVLSTMLSAGEHLITLFVNDGEYNNSAYVMVSVMIDPDMIDTDEDGIPDIQDPDDDNDGLLDSDEDLNGNGLIEFDQGETDPKNPDTDQDGINDMRDEYPLDPSTPPPEEEKEYVPQMLTIIVISLFLPVLIIIALVIILFFVFRKRSSEE